MPRTISFKPEVRVDIQESYDWYEEQSSGLGERFLVSVDECLDAIRENPHAFQTVFKGARRALVSSFPYALFYVVRTDDIVVIGCCHTSRDPAHWQKRI